MKIKPSTLLSLILLFCITIPLVFGYSIMTNPPSDSPKGEYSFEVKDGDTLSSVSEKLANESIIPYPISLRSIALTRELAPLQKGKYTLTLPDTPSGVFDQLNRESKKIADSNAKALLIKTKKITIREGLTLDRVIKLLAEEGVSSEAELVSTANDIGFFQSKYEFLPKKRDCEYGNIKTCVKFYLEGYLYPDTYEFVEGIKARDVYIQMLNNFEKKVWSKLKPTTSVQELYDLLVLSSVVEKESGRTKGVTPESAPVVEEERKRMATVFTNRIKKGMKWQSNPTVTYGSESKVCEKTFEIKGCVYLDDPSVAHLYNTYRIDGAPIGPITSPQWAVIASVKSPLEHNDLYFISDITGKTYFASDGVGHENNIAMVKKINAQF